MALIRTKSHWCSLTKSGLMFYHSQKISAQVMKTKKKIQKLLKTTAWISSLTNLSPKKQIAWMYEYNRTEMHQVAIKRLLIKIRLRSDFPKLVSMALSTYCSQRRFDGQRISSSFSPVKQQHTDHYR